MGVLLTGHTGFKGGWLALMLKAQGHEMFGISLSPEVDSVFNQVSICRFLSKDTSIDIRDKAEL